MKKYFIILAALLPTQPVLAGTIEDTKANCVADWPGYPDMQEFCFKRQIEAARQIKDMLGEELSTALASKCLTLWRRPKGDGYNWSAVVDCIRATPELYHE